MVPGLVQSEAVVLAVEGGSSRAAGITTGAVNRSVAGGRSCDGGEHGLSGKPGLSSDPDRGTTEETPRDADPGDRRIARPDGAGSPGPNAAGTLLPRTPLRRRRRRGQPFLGSNHPPGRSADPVAGTGARDRPLVQDRTRIRPQAHEAHRQRHPRDVPRTGRA